MSNVDDARNAIRALLNQVPDTMEATQSALHLLSAIGAATEDDGDISPEKLLKTVSKLAMTLTACVVSIEQRLEEADGRPGLRETSWDAIFTEFDLG